MTIKANVTQEKTDPENRVLLPFRAFLLVSLFLVVAPVCVAQQREAAIEVFVVGGPYAYGNLVLSPQSTSISPQWRPHVGGGVLVPWGKNWGALIDLTTSAVEVSWKWDGRIGVGPDEVFSQVRRLSLVPSVVRLWRMETLSIYAGGGLGVEHDRERNRLRRIVARSETGEPLLADEFTTTRGQKTHLALAFRVGAIVSLSSRFVARFGYSYLRTHMDVGATQGFETGIGWRF